MLFWLINNFHRGEAISQKKVWSFNLFFFGTRPIYINVGCNQTRATYLAFSFKNHKCNVDFCGRNFFLEAGYMKIGFILTKKKYEIPILSSTIVSHNTWQVDTIIIPLYPFNSLWFFRFFEKIIAQIEWFFFLVSQLLTRSKRFSK